MSDFRSIDRMRSRVFVVELPGMTPRNERFLIKRCRELAQSAMASGVPLGVAWSQMVEFADRASRRLRTEQERETFVAIMQRLRQEVFQEFNCVSR